MVCCNWGLGPRSFAYFLREVSFERSGMTALSWAEWEGHSTTGDPAECQNLLGYNDRVATGRVK